MHVSLCARETFVPVLVIFPSLETRGLAYKAAERELAAHAVVNAQPDYVNARAVWPLNF